MNCRYAAYSIRRKMHRYMQFDTVSFKTLHAQPRQNARQNAAQPGDDQWPHFPHSLGVRMPGGSRFQVHMPKVTNPRSEEPLAAGKRQLEQAFLLWLRQKIHQPHEGRGPSAGRRRARQTVAAQNGARPECLGVVGLQCT